ncbi:hypothetical protein [Tenggerimyces flavus]|uniref:Septum formation initiator n=1 Tax=Tenggerimyces flavus TaxID=1708749 RepID=A0ABV7YN92_9ACTN|nr:hypothetical protein [Tenggerimyces flavus]MBM7784617.1 serine/threonine-protein kinase [Tenggerimyces flavus]
MWKRGILLGVLGWLAVAAGAVTVGVLAVTLVGSGLTSGSSQPLSSDGVSRALGATSPSPSPTATFSPTPTPTPAKTPSSPTKPFTSPGGTAYAQCTSGQAYLTSWSPHPGFETDEVERGPDSRVSVRFEADDTKIRLIIRCSGNTPQASTETDIDD